ncbi:MAG: hypothetical protein IV090_05960 [Candidatus Sericytochromatia bacterium]|nr:hypothetical protein [Candidatus Sericytochromatia bacterium]
MLKNSLFLLFVLFTHFGCKKNIDPATASLSQKTLTSSPSSQQANATPTPELIDENTCHQTIEVDKDNIHFKTFEQFKVGYIMPFKTIFKNCSFKGEDVKQHTFSLINNGKNIIFSATTEEQTKPVRTTALPSYCSFYFATGQTDISLVAETELKNGEVIKSLPFTLHLNPDHIKYCETPGTPMTAY